MEQDREEAKWQEVLERLEQRGEHRPVPEEVERAGREIIGAAIEVHRHLGPGLMEGVYERAMVHELQLRGLTVNQQVPILVPYKGLLIEGQRADLIVQPGVILELKAVDAFNYIHDRQLLSYLLSTGLRLGLLINFHAKLLKHGIRRIVC
ncbi:MAG: GxxExxY protein [Planctomycetota bacterium]|nr:GxxExxY protein [Planctomycetota bacterium]